MKNVTILKCYILEVLKQNLKGQTQWDHAQISCQNVKNQSVCLNFLIQICTFFFEKHYLFNET
jgi:hypothetical protein